MKKRTYVPEHNNIEFQQIVEQFKNRGSEHERVAIALTEDPQVLTKDSSRLNKTALLRSINKVPITTIKKEKFDPSNEDHYVDVKEEEKINNRRLEELIDEFKRCFEHYA